ncbi:hypothetical protein [Marisediminicola sp. LYQ85]|uniref:hypothetical protein n=1 Tax=Marisediminicola sp. LYQ85 TaxID=3391062 RepID=UPI003982F150
MENDFSNRPSAAEAAASLDDLELDRHTLAEGARVPRVLTAALGGVAAWWVGMAASTTPGADYEPPNTAWLAVAAVLVIGYLIRRELGVKFRAIGAKAVGALVAILVLCLALYSVSLGFVSFGLTWAVALTSLAAFALVTWLSGVAYRSALDNLRRG